MIYIIGYIVGVLICTYIIGLYRGNLKYWEQDELNIAVGFWPITVPITAVVHLLKHVYNMSQPKEEQNETK